MKFLHTSDWHLGMTWRGGISYRKDQEFMIRQICRIAAEEQVDGILLAGDIFDKSIASQAINNSGAIFEDHLPKIVKSHVVIEYCDPIYMEDLSKEEKRFIGKQVADIIVTHYEKNKELV